uniref:Uncharacterized protein n=1 Tax=viral metagenome TaxID=1070528 RepID=A0A6C0BE50_9ZZZZ
MDELTIIMIIVWSLVALYALYLVVNSGILKPTVEKKIEGYSVKPNKKPKPVVITKPKPVVITKPKPVVITKPKPVVITKPKPVVVNKPQPVVMINTGVTGGIKKVPIKSNIKIKSPEERVIRTGANPKDIEEIYNRAKIACNTTKYESEKHYQDCSYIYPNGITNPPAIPNLRYDDMGPYYITGGFTSKLPVQSTNINLYNNDKPANSSIGISGAIVEELPKNSTMVATIDGYMNSPGSSLQYLDGNITGGIIY